MQRFQPHRRRGQDASCHRPVWFMCPADLWTPPPPCQAGCRRDPCTDRAGRPLWRCGRSELQRQSQSTHTDPTPSAPAGHLHLHRAINVGRLARESVAPSAFGRCGGGQDSQDSADGRHAFQRLCRGPAHGLLHLRGRRRRGAHHHRHADVRQPRPVRAHPQRAGERRVRAARLDDGDGTADVAGRRLAHHLRLHLADAPRHRRLR